MLAAHPRAPRRGELVVDPAHWDGLPDGHTRATTLDRPPEPPPDVGPDRADPTRSPRCWPRSPQPQPRSRVARWRLRRRRRARHRDRRPEPMNHPPGRRAGPRLDQRKRATSGPSLAGRAGPQLVTWLISASEPPSPCAEHPPRRRPAPRTAEHRRRDAVMNELITTRIRDHATRLALPHLAENLDGLVARAEADTMGYLEFVDLLLGEEVGLREGRRFRTALKLSGLPAPQEPRRVRLRLPTRPRPPQGPRPRRPGVRRQPTTTSPCSAHPASARPTSPSRSRSPPARPATRSTSPASTKPSGNSAPPRPPAGSPRSSRPTYDPPSSSSTRSATCRWTGPRRTWCSS